MYLELNLNILCNCASQVNLPWCLDICTGKQDKYWLRNVFFSRFSHSSSSGAADCKVGKWLFSVQMCSSSCWQMSHGLAARPVFLVEMAMQHLVRFPHDLYSSWHTSGFWIAAGRAAGMKTRMCLIASNVYRFPPSRLIILTGSLRAELWVWLVSLVEDDSMLNCLSKVTEIRLLP